jgi:hypothetical protein
MVPNLPVRTGAFPRRQQRFARAGRPGEVRLLPTLIERSGFALRTCATEPIPDGSGDGANHRGPSFRQQVGHHLRGDDQCETIMGASRIRVAVANADAQFRRSLIAPPASQSLFSHNRRNVKVGSALQFGTQSDRARFLIRSHFSRSLVRITLADPPSLRPSCVAPLAPPRNSG